MDELIDEKTTEFAPVVADLWHPQWLVDVGDVMMGITKDDGCFVVLTQTVAGRWRPATHIPAQAANMLGQLATDQSLHVGA